MQHLCLFLFTDNIVVSAFLSVQIAFSCCLIVAAHRFISLADKNNRSSVLLESYCESCLHQMIGSCDFCYRFVIELIVSVSRNVGVGKIKRIILGFVSYASAYAVNGCIIRFLIRITHVSISRSQGYHSEFQFSA